MRRALTLLILGVAVVVLVASPVIGHTRKTDTNVFITQAMNGRYKGKVVSPSGRCELNRTVVVWHDSDPDFRIGVTSTNLQGEWRLSGPQPPSGDEIYAVARLKVLVRNHRHRHVCRRDDSGNVKYPKP